MGGIWCGESIIPVFLIELVGALLDEELMVPVRLMISFACTI